MQTSALQQRQQEKDGKLAKYLGDQSVDVTCECGQAISRTVKQLEDETPFSCPRCHKQIKIESSDLRAKLREVDDLLDNFMK